MEVQNKRGFFAVLMVVTLAVLAVICVMTINSNAPMSVGRRLGAEAATAQETKMAFKAMKLNTKYELKTEQRTILRGGTLTARHDAAASMKANIYAGIKDMKKVVLEGLPGAVHNHRRLSDASTEEKSVPTQKIAAKAKEVGGSAPTSKKEAKAEIKDLRSEIKTDKKMLPKADTKDEKEEIKTEIKDDKKAIENDQVVVLDAEMMTAKKASSVKQAVALPSGVTEPTKGTTLLPPKKNSELGQVAGVVVAKSSSSNLVDGKESKASSTSSSSSSSSSSSKASSSSKTLSNVKNVKVKDEEKKDDVKDEKKVDKKAETAAVAGKDGKTTDNKKEKEEKEGSSTKRSEDEVDHRKLPSVAHVKGAYKAMKGQIKTSMLMSKPYILLTADRGATFPVKHDAIRALKLEIKGAINSERSIVETDDDDDYSIRRLADETKAKIARKMDAAQAATKQA